MRKSSNPCGSRENLIHVLTCVDMHVFIIECLSFTGSVSLNYKLCGFGEGGGKVGQLI